MNFTFTTSLGGAAIKQPVDFGTVSNTGGTSTIPLYMSHDSISDLDNVGIYLQPFTGTNYIGLYGPSQDYLDFLEWGATTNEGLNANMDAASTTPSFDNYFKSSTGASASNAIPLSTAMFGAAISSGEGNFPVGETGHLTFEMSIPPTETNTGLRMASVFLRFDQ